MAEREIPLGEYTSDDDGRRAGSLMAAAFMDAIDLSSEQGTITWVTDGSKRLAAIAPVIVISRGLASDGHQIAAEQIRKHGRDRYPTTRKQLAKVADELVELGLAIGRMDGSYRWSDDVRVTDEYADVGLALFELGNKLGLDLVGCMRNQVDADGRRFSDE